MVTNFHQGESLEVGIYGGVKYTQVEQVLFLLQNLNIQHIWIMGTFENL
jgi:hypothetical protein